MAPRLLRTFPMGILFRLACLGCLIAAAGGPRAKDPELHSGDVVLHASTSSRSALIRRASASVYSHVGLIEVARDGVFVIEAVQPVSRTPWKAWRARGEGGKVTVLRPKEVAPDALARVVAAAKRELGKPYDARYRWDDEALYCSELVTKAYARGAGLEVGRPQRVSSLFLTTQELALARRLGIDPAATLVTPGSFAGDEHFEEIYTDF